MENVTPPPVTDRVKNYGILALLIPIGLYSLYIIIYGILIVLNKYDRVGVEATVKEVKCLSNLDRYSCSLYLEYTYNSNQYTVWIDTNKVDYTPGSKLVIYIVSDKPTDVGLDTPPSHSTGTICILSGVIIMIMAFIIKNCESK